MLEELQLGNTHLYRYGLPYKGSKRKLAERIIEALPKADNFYDIFGGGGAVMHCALKFGRFKNYHLNDIEQGLPQLLKGCLDKTYKPEYRWISREEFKARKDGTSLDDVSLSICWSFGNDRKTYAYGETIEEYKKALWYAKVEHNFDLMEKLGIELKDFSIRNVKANEEYLRGKLCNAKTMSGDDYSVENLASMSSLTRLQSLESMEVLNDPSVLDRLEITNLSYEKVEIPENTIVYCDIPYEDTSKYKVEFDHKAFYDWAMNQKELVVISSYKMPDNFKTVACWSHICSLAQTTTNVVEEKLFVPENKYDEYIERTGGNIASKFFN